MGSSQICNTNTADRKSEIEQVAFKHVNSHLQNMRHCERADLIQAAFSYLLQSVNASGAGHLFGATYAQRKAEKWAGWWHTKHTASRSRRPHTKYSAPQALRGRQVALIRKKGATDWTALRAQLARDRGDKLAEIARELGCTIRTVSNLSKRLFPKIIGVVLDHLFRWKHGKSSVARTPHKQDVPKPEQLRCFYVEGVQAGERPAERVQVDEIDEIEALEAICNVIRQHLSRVLLRSGPLNGSERH